MYDIIRDAPLGQTIRWVSGNKYLQYPEEAPDFELPPQYRMAAEDEKTSQPLGSDLSRSRTRIEQPDELDEASQHNPSIDSSRTGEVADVELGQVATRKEDGELERLRTIKSTASVPTAPYTAERFESEQHMQTLRTQSIAIVPEKTKDGVILVDWYTTDDPANPQNWSRGKKAFITLVVCGYTWATYIAGALFAPCEPGVEQHFGVSPEASELGLSLYVLAYGVGPMVFGPLTEIPAVGRNPVYFFSFIIFFALSFPTAVVNDFGGLLALRFFQGFFSSPAIGIGGASITDVYAFLYAPYGLGWWVYSFWAGPAFGPMIGGFAATAKGWRWPLWEIVWISAPMVLILLILTPETSSHTILLRRAQRLRKRTGMENLQSQSEIDQKALKFREIVFSTLFRPWEIMLKDPSVLFVNLYTAYFYGTYYTFFEVFPIVFGPFYGFNLGEIGTVFLANFTGATIGLIMYFAYIHWYLIPDTIKNGLREQEHRLIPSIFGSFFLPVGMFMFAWTANAQIVWIVPLIGCCIFSIGGYLIVQGLFMYIPMSYPNYGASLFTSNDFARSAVAAGCIQAARPLFINLGVHRGCSLLAGVSVAGVIGTLVLYFFGKQLRARSKFAQS